MTIRPTISLSGVAGFGLAAGFAVVQEWSLPEFCWSTWLAGLVFTWMCIATASLRSILIARSWKAACERRVPIIRRLSPKVFVLGATTLALCAGWLAFRISCFVFAFYGLFLSVFTRMQPESLFGPNGFINSDFYAPVVYLLERFWPTALGVVVAHGDACLCRQPWKHFLFPLGSEIVRLHVVVLSVPFLSLIAWLLCGDRFQTMTILLLMGLLYLLPRRLAPGAPGNPEVGQQTPAGDVLVAAPEE